jgi:sensor histidine kinase YesM
MLDRFNDYLRATLTVTRAGQGTLKEEFTLLENYLGLLQIRMGERLAFELELPAQLENMPLPPMLLQPLVENAVKHGLEPKIDGGRVRIDARAEGGMLCLSVTDTGLGLGSAVPTEREGEGGSLGLRNVRGRMRALYGDSATLVIAEQPSGGVLAELRLPLAIDLPANTAPGDRA